MSAFNCDSSGSNEHIDIKDIDIKYEDLDKGPSHVDNYDLYITNRVDSTTDLGSTVVNGGILKTEFDSALSETEKPNNEVGSGLNIKTEVCTTSNGGPSNIIVGSNLNIKTEIDSFSVPLCNIKTEVPDDDNALTPVELDFVAIKTEPLAEADSDTTLITSSEIKSEITGIDESSAPVEHDLSEMKMEIEEQESKNFNLDLQQPGTSSGHQAIQLSKTEWTEEMRTSPNELATVKRGFSCLYCSFVAVRLDVLNDHLCTEHYLKGLYQCLLCNDRLKGPENLKMHIAVHFRDIKYSCQYCEFVETNLNVFIGHMTENHSNNTTNCPYCKIMVEICDLNGHLIEKHANVISAIGVIQSCPKCDYRCVNNSNMKVHIRNMHKKDQYTCEQCGYMATTPLLLRNHVKTTHFCSFVALHPCPKCDYKARNKSKLKQHMKVKHDYVDDYKCSVCKFSTDCSGKLDQHVDKFHSCYKCSICDFTTEHRTYFSRHLRKKHSLKVGSNLKDFMLDES